MADKQKPTSLVKIHVMAKLINPFHLQHGTMGLGFNTFIVGTLACSYNFDANMVTIVAQKFDKTNLSICCAISFREREREIILEQRIMKQQRNKMYNTIAPSSHCLL
jgi:hypothetical protein